MTKIIIAKFGKEKWVILRLFSFLFFFLTQPHEGPEKWRSSSTPRSRSVDTSEDRNGGGGVGGVGKNENGGRKGNGKTTSAVTAAATNKMKKKRRGRAGAASAASTAGAAAAERKWKVGGGRSRLESTLLRLRQKLPGKNPIDASYLLESDKRLRKKNLFASKFFMT